MALEASLRYVLGLDLGTSSLKAVLIDQRGAVAAVATRGYSIQAPRPGWAEQDPEHWWEACCAATRSLLADGLAGGDRVVAVALSGQMHGTVLLDRAGAVLRPAIIWPDGRAAEEASEAEAKLADRGLLPRLGGGVSPGFMLASLLWCRMHEPAVWRDTATALLPKDYLRYRLTGELASDPSDGSSIPAIDLHTGQWSIEALATLDLPPDLLPPIISSSAVAGEITASAADQCGLRPGTPVLCGGSDQAMAAIGAGLLHPGSLLVSVSTGGQLIAPIAAPLGTIEHGLRTVCHALPADVTQWTAAMHAPLQARHHVESSSHASAEGTPRVTPPGRLAMDAAGTTNPPPGFSGGYLALSATLGAGLSVHWLRETLFQGADRVDDAELLREAAQVPAGAGGLLFLPYLAGERSPILDPEASGALVGLRLAHGRPHIARAALEGIAYSLRHALEPMRAAGVETEHVVLAGGLSRNQVVRAILAGVLNEPLLPLVAAEQSALGAALLAAVHAGFFTTLDDACATAIRFEAPVVPLTDDVTRYAELYARYRGLYPALRTTMHGLRERA
jgi:xylulokinase